MTASPEQRAVIDSNAPTYMGQPANQGRLIPAPLFPNEGFAVLKCGGTEIVLSYTLLHHLRFELHKDDSCWLQIVKANEALAAITCEASIGKTA